MITIAVNTPMLFYPYSGHDPLPAFVAAVHSQTSVNLGIFDKNGVVDPKPPVNIPVIQIGAPAPNAKVPYYCTPMSA
jgi:hypothetical protein